MKFAILDDNKEFLETIKCSLKNYTAEVDMTYFTDTDRFIDFVTSNSQELNGVFIDIILNDKSGLEIAEKVYRIKTDIRIVYVTGYVKEYCQNIFTTNPDIKPFAFLTKPLDESVLFKILDMFAENISYKNEVLIKTKKGYCYINPADICYVESCNRNVRFYMKNKAFHDCYGKIKDFMSVLDGNYSYSHQSIYVNLRHVRAFDNKKAYLSNGEEVPITQTYQKQFKSELLAFKSSDEDKVSV